MGVDLMTYRSRIASFRGGIDVINVIVGVQFTKALKCLITLLTVVTNLACVIHPNIGYEVGMSDEQNASVVVIQSADILLWCTGCVAIVDQQKYMYVGAVAFIQILLLASGIESNPGPLRKESGCLKTTCTFERLRTFGMLPTSHCEHTSQLFKGGTCSYLLGNKGVHIVNGNPRTDQMQDEATIPVHGLTLLAQDVQESVAYICIFEYERNEPTPDEETRTVIGCGTGFRVGDRHLMSAYHVFREAIDDMLNIIVSKCCDGTDEEDAIFKEIADRLEIDTMRETSSLPNELYRLLKMYLAKTATNIDMLLHRISELVDPDIRRDLDKHLRRHCIVDFMKHGEFTVHWNIAFGDEESDIIILTLNENDTSQDWPKALMLDQNFRQQDHSFIMRFIDDGNPKVTMDVDTKIYTESSVLEHEVKNADAWWHKNCLSREREHFQRGYSDMYDKRNGKVFLRASRSFTKGSSGSPVLYLSNESGHAVVSMVYQGGQPKFYYDQQNYWDTIFSSYGKKIDSKCFFEEGITLEQVGVLLDKFGKESLKRTIFRQPHESPVKDIGIDTDATLKSLGLLPNLDKKLSFEDVMRISMRTQDLCRANLPRVMLERLIMVDYNARDEVPYLVYRPNDDDGDVSDDEMFLDDRDDEEIDIQDDAFSVQKIPSNHDIFYIIFNCCNPMLKNVLVNKLFKCRLAVPFIYPTFQPHDLCFSMWPMRMVNLEINLERENNNYLFSEFPQSIVSFVRMKRPLFSKSILLNAVLAQQTHPTFFNKDCALGSQSRYFSDGIVEASWYIPAGNASDLFKDLTLFANLRGDALAFGKQFDTLREISHVIVLVINWLDLKKEIESVRNIAKEGLSLVILLVGRHPPNARNFILKKFSKCSHLAIIPCFKNDIEQNIFDLKNDIRKKIKTCLANTMLQRSLENCAKMARDKGIENDEQDEKCRNSKEKCVKLMEFVYGIKDPLQVKKQLLPLQGEIFGKIVELKSQLKRMNSDKLLQKETIKDSIRELRKEQRKHALDMPSMFKEFIQYFTANKSDKEALSYFIHWMKFLLNKYTQSILPKFTKDRQEKWKEYEKATRIPSSNIDNCKKDLELAVKSAENVSFSFEHFVRELSQIYESCKLFELQSENPNLQLAMNLPEVAADILLQGYPLELMNGDVDSIPLAWIEAVLSSCISQIGDKKLYVLSVVGIQSSGKSTFLNTIFGISFDVSVGRCTRGINMKLIPVAEKDKFPFDYLLILDTEGLRAPERGSNTIYRDNKLATLVFGIANMTLINIKGENKMELTGVLEIVVHTLLKLKLANGKICLNPSCLFVHQNVAATDAQNKSQPGNQISVQELDEITKAITDELGLNNIASFHQIIRFDSDMDVHFISDLWNGDPPMAHVNPGYSRKCDDVKEKLLSRMHSDGGNTMTISTFLAHITDLWKGLMSEEFILGFRNNVEVKAYLTMEMEYQSQKWDFEKFKMEWMIDNRNKEHEKDVINKTIDEEFGYKRNEILNSFRCFFENSTLRGTLIQWKSSQIKIMEVYCNNVIETMKMKIQKIQDEKTQERKVESRVNLLLKEIDKEAKQVAKEYKGRKTPIETTTVLFEGIWVKIMGEVMSDESTCGDSIRCRIQGLLLSFSKSLETALNDEIKIQQQRPSPTELRFTDLDQCEHGKHFNLQKSDFDLRKPVTESKLTEDTLKHCMKDVDLFTKSLFVEILAEINKIKITLDVTCAEFQEAHLVNVLKLIQDSCEENNTKVQSLITFLPKYQAMVMVYVSRYVEHIFNEAQKVYEERHGLKTRIIEYKNATLKHFENMLNDRSNEYMTASLLCEEARVELEKKLQDKVILEQQNLIRKEFGHSKENFIRHILEDLQDQKQYELFEKYLDSPISYSLNWFCEHARKIRSSEKFLAIIEDIVKDFCQRLKNDVMSAPLKLSEPDKMKHFLTGISAINISQHMKAQICHYDINNIENFFDGVKYLISEIEQQNYVLTFVSQWDQKKDIEMFNDLWGCTEVCPFCNEPCRYMKDHTQINVPHRCVQHRPLGLCTKHRRYSKTLTLESCCFKVGSKQEAYCIVFENRCKNTQSDHSADEEEHPYKDYKKFFPNWDIECSPDMDSSKFWMWFVATYKDDLHKSLRVYISDVPNSWSRITKEKANKSLSMNTGWFTSNPFKGFKSLFQPK